MIGMEKKEMKVIPFVDAAAAGETTKAS